MVQILPQQLKNTGKSLIFRCFSNFLSDLHFSEMAFVHYLSIILERNEISLESGRNFISPKKLSMEKVEFWVFLQLFHEFQSNGNGRREFKNPAVVCFSVGLNGLSGSSPLGFGGWHLQQFIHHICGGGLSGLNGMGIDFHGSGRTCVPERTEWHGHRFSW